MPWRRTRRVYAGHGYTDRAKKTGSPAAAAVAAVDNLLVLRRSLENVAPNAAPTVAADRLRNTVAAAAAAAAAAAVDAAASAAAATTAAAAAAEGAPGEQGSRELVPLAKEVSRDTILLVPLGQQARAHTAAVVLLLPGFRHHRRRQAHAQDHGQDHAGAEAAVRARWDAASTHGCATL